MQTVHPNDKLQMVDAILEIIVLETTMHSNGKCNLGNCHNPSFGLTTKARACKGVGQKEAWESHLMLPGV
jgi:hypothetical protein